MREDSPNLDLLRSLAVLIVVTSHLPAFRHLVDGPHYSGQAIGLVGVAAFFVHTCLVLMMSLDRQLEKAPGAPLAAPFLIRRVFRIYPLSVLIVSILSLILLLRHEEPSLRTFLSDLLLVQNLNGAASIPPPLWTLPYEMQMYLLLPALYLMARRLRARATLGVLVLWVASVAVTVLAFRRGWNWYNQIVYIPCFLPGVLAFTWRGRQPRLSVGVLVAFLCLTVWIIPAALTTWGMSHRLMLWPFCLTLGLLIPHCREIESEGLARVARVVARYSYGIYLIHYPVIDFAFGQERFPAVAQWLIFVVGTGTLSFAAYHLIEKPGVAFGKQLATRYAGTRMVAALPSIHS